MQEGVRLSTDAGPEGVRRGVRAAQVLFDVSQTYVTTLLRGGSPERPEVLLRRTFERLGATYIKLGQFVASSPSLFPAEYVAEFQKLLDRTDPEPFETVRATIESELARPIDEVRVL